MYFFSENSLSALLSTAVEVAIDGNYVRCYRFSNVLSNKRGQIIYPDGIIFHPDKASAISNVILDYGYIMENAEEIHILDSAFYCLSNYLDLSNVKKKIVYTRCENLDTYTKQPGWIVINIE